MLSVIITDSDPAMHRAALIELPTTHYIFCIWHIKENLKKMLCVKLGAEFDSFYSAFWKDTYMNNCVLENSNTSLCEISKVLLDQAENRVNKRKYEDLVREVSSTTNNVIIFPKSVFIIQHFCSNIEEVENIPTGKPSGNEFFEDEPDSILVYT
ncbi:12942_t:CDS:2 [Dentiscutata erythropus]|uniref:12942_t:CDS:1 n=1 Tax=Dentiscutata erythropus TaxID=1348616 RepID=A0A9N9DWL1_9GLOM|nr:12942_t:CDS:2 [Dentiscutata erythropus]